MTLVSQWNHWSAQCMSCLVYFLNMLQAVNQLGASVWADFWPLCPRTGTTTTPDALNTPYRREICLGDPMPFSRLRGVMLGREVGRASSAAAVGSLPAHPWKAWTAGLHEGCRERALTRWLILTGMMPSACSWPLGHLHSLAASRWRHWPNSAPDLLTPLPEEVLGEQSQTLGTCPWERLERRLGKTVVIAGDFDLSHPELYWGHRPGGAAWKEEKRWEGMSVWLWKPTVKQGTLSMLCPGHPSWPGTSCLLCLSSPCPKHRWHALKGDCEA